MKHTRINRNKTFAPPRRSIYRKLQIVLMEIRKSKTSSEADLIQRVRKTGHDDFTAYVNGEPKPCSVEAVEHVISLAKELRLVDSVTGSLTIKGERAADPTEFDAVVRKSLQDLLEHLGGSRQKLISLTSRLLSEHSSESLPTWEVLCDNLFPDSDFKTRKKFQELLGLLAMCGGIRFSRRKIYLPD